MRNPAPALAYSYQKAQSGPPDLTSPFDENAFTTYALQKCLGFYRSIFGREIMLHHLS